ncbi:hypothetical protein [Streptomyces litchfieldiae]|uniref:Uncharacterized protein n=1 Tax=Streptomyces litchfieldiae TaxID=3075543 RepID=A0ABU2MU77_9ACTN|nr:hypothetical protein [Streptomyces sp. DSM 44938]MDT0345191.1 hypothetical protein [Streptomyces sp. DSM 44938]
MVVLILCMEIEHFGLSLTRAHYETLADLAARVGEADVLENMDLRRFVEDDDAPTGVG